MKDIEVFDNYLVVRVNEEGNPSTIYVDATKTLYQIISANIIPNFENKDGNITLEEKIDEQKKYVGFLVDGNDGELALLFAEVIMLPMGWYFELPVFKRLEKDEQYNKIKQIASIFHSSLMFTIKHKNHNNVMYGFENFQKNMDILNEFISKIIENENVQDDLGIYKSICDTIHSDIKYAPQFLIGTQEKFEKESDKSPETFNIFNPIVCGVGVCQSFASLYAFIAFILGFEVKIIYWINEPSVNHFNCLVKHKNKFYIADPTSGSFFEIDTDYFEDKKYQII